METKWFALGHGARFNITEGEVLEGPASDDVGCYKVPVNGDNIEIEIYRGMSMDIEEQVKAYIEKIIPDAKTEVQANGNHFNITVISSAFEGKNSLAKQRLVYSAIAPLMTGATAPIHAVDSLKTLTPSSE